MCYSAMVEQHLRSLAREFQAEVDWGMFETLFRERLEHGDIKIARALEAITDEPPPEIAATGHNRCVITLRRSNVDGWLAPEGVSLDRLDRILIDRERPFYEHRIAA